MEFIQIDNVVSKFDMDEKPKSKNGKNNKNGSVCNNLGIFPKKKKLFLYQTTMNLATADSIHSMIDIDFDPVSFREID